MGCLRRAFGERLPFVEGGIVVPDQNVASFPVMMVNHSLINDLKDSVQDRAARRDLVVAEIEADVPFFQCDALLPGDRVPKHDRFCEVLESLKRCRIAVSALAGPLDDIAELVDSPPASEY